MLGKMNEEEIELLLKTTHIARIGMHVDGRTYIVPVTFAYDGSYIIGHSAEGLKMRMMRENPEVCFQVDRIEGMANWQSVVAWGTFEELYEQEAMKALLFLSSTFMNILTSRTALPAYGFAHERTGGQIMANVYRIKLREKTGRFEMPVR